jgi:hypothetical protein
MPNNKASKKKAVRGFNQRVAETVGASPKYVSMILTGYMPPQGRKAMKIIQAANDLRKADQALIETLEK